MTQPSALYADHQFLSDLSEEAGTGRKSKLRALASIDEQIADLTRQREVIDEEADDLWDTELKAADEAMGLSDLINQLTCRDGRRGSE